METFSPKELRAIRAFRDPAGIQRFLDSIPYHLANTSWSPRRVLSDRTAHCLEGAIFAAAALRVLGHPPWVVDLEAERDTDHVIAVYRERGLWGSIAASNYSTCRGRQPVYRSVRELAMSYFDGYFNLARERTLRNFSRPQSLSRFDRLGWETASGDIWYIAEFLCDIPHTPLLPKKHPRLARVDERGFRSGLVGHRKK